MSNEHTATPWKRDQYGNVKSEDGELILLTGFALNGGRASKLAESNSDFVFRACNSHDALVAACQEFVRKCDDGFAYSKNSYAQMKAALALAGIE